MAKTQKRRYGKKRSFDKEITITFFEMLLMVKLYHWRTHSFATHKATDDLYKSLNEHMDKFIEVLLGKTGSRMNFSDKKSIQLIDIESPIKLKQRIEAFKKYLSNIQIKDTDLLNIRDEILSDLNQFTYLLTFS
jgi:DNA-binding ferritin-like protein